MRCEMLSGPGTATELVVSVRLKLRSVNILAGSTNWVRGRGVGMVGSGYIVRMKLLKNK